MSKLKVEFIDNASSQYDESAARIKITKNPNATKKAGRLYLGDRNSASYIQLKFRNVKTVVTCSREMHGFCKEPEVKYLKIDPEDVGNTHFDEAFNFMEIELGQGRNVVVHCENGLNKSAAVVAYYVMKKESLSLAASLRRVDKARTVKIAPQIVRMLMEAEKRLTGANTVSLDGRKVVYLDEHYGHLSGPKGGSKANPYLPLYILGGVGGFFAVVFGALYLATGKI